MDGSVEQRLDLELRKVSQEVELAAAKNLISSRDFDRALVVLDSLLKDSSLEDETIRNDALFYIAVAFYEKEDAVACQAALKNLADAFPQDQRGPALRKKLHDRTIKDVSVGAFLVLGGGIAIAAIAWIMLKKR